MHVNIIEIYVVVRLNFGLGLYICPIYVYVGGIGSSGLCSLAVQTGHSLFSYVIPTKPQELADNKQASMTRKFHNQRSQTNP